jgi:Spy/CpxP family protein refolding chaperone
MLAVALMLTLGIGVLGTAGTTRAQGPSASSEASWTESDRGRMDPGGPGLRGSGMRGMGMRGMGMRHRRMDMMRELDLSKDQREKIAAMREKQERSAIRMRADLQTSRLDLRRLMRSEKSDRMAINRQIDRLAQLRADMQKARVGMMLDMRGVLTPEQQERARERMGR